MTVLIVTPGWPQVTGRVLQRAADLVGRGRIAPRDEQGRHPGHVGRGHRGTLKPLIGEVKQVTELGIEGLLEHPVGVTVPILIHAHVPARSHHVQSSAEVGIGSAGRIKADGAYGDGLLVGGGIEDAGFVVVARGRHHGHPPPNGVLHRVAQEARWIRPPQAHIDHLSTMIGGPGDAVGHVGVGTISVLVQHLDRHDTRPKGHTGHPFGVVCGLSDGAGDVGAVAVVIVGVVIIVDEIMPLDESGTGQVWRLSKILEVLISYPGIHDGHRHATAVAQIPGGGHLDLL